MDIQSNLEKVKRSTHGQVIIAATKYVDDDVIRQLFHLGVKDMGENRVQDFIRKQEKLIDLPIRWHFIGHLQTNKVKMVINKIDYLHSLDSEKLAIAINQYRQYKLQCFVEVKLTDEPNKTGIEIDQLNDFIHSLAQYDIIQVVGLMGMAKANGATEEVKESFQTLKTLRDNIEKLNLPYAPCHYLSMGMSDDYQIAIECQSTHLRLGSILFRNEEKS